MEKTKLNEMVQQLNVKHKNDFPKIEEPVLIIVKLSNDEEAYFEVSKNGIVEHFEKIDVPNQVVISFRDLEKIEKNTKLLIPYLMKGRIQLKGNVKKLINAIEILF